MNTYGLEKLGIINPLAVYRNLPVPALVEDALLNGEGALSETGALVVETGKYTGRSPNDKFIVKDEVTADEIDWGSVNVPMTKENFWKIYDRVVAYLQNRELYIFDGFAGADSAYRKNIRIVNEFASQNMFIHQLLLRPEESELENFEADYTIIAAPGFNCIPERDGTNSEAAILVNYTEKIVVIAGTQYSGEIKKSVFSIMNYILPKEGVFPMHCSANMGDEGDVALFFGLSGTGKTTLSADPNRKLIGDDEHGWTDSGVFNFEGGCYAKCINLSEENEPEIWNAIRFGALVENVVMDEETRVLDYDDDSLTENTRVGYPIEFIPNAQIPGVGGSPNAVIFLTADAFGVMPPVSKLSREQAMYQFVSGYTARLAGTERGVTEPQATFSTCFGAPFLPFPAKRYADLLAKYVDQTGASVYLVNTGWSGGPAGKGGSRMALKYTRAMITAILNGELDKADFETDPIFNVMVPTSCPNVPAEILTPKNTWEDKAAYDADAKKLAQMFRDNFKQYDMSEEVINAGPKGE
ncbi:MAG: phosphoenolpyruvate carboxykinase (ATP) [Christensenellaceae bacterium]|jgi:phosphoenolpyruvate carboxykinase (ATP)